MTNRLESPPVAARSLGCARCGTAFSCDLTGNCWCVAEDVRLPMPTGGGDCLCPACLREAARLSATGEPGRA